jgi:hypothetical protein
MIDLNTITPGTTLEGIPAGINSDSTPITRAIQVTVDRIPWFCNERSVTLSDGRSVTAVRADTLRIVPPREAADAACAARNQRRDMHRHQTTAEVKACRGCQDAETTAAVAYRAYLAAERQENA